MNRHRCFTSTLAAGAIVSVVVLTTVWSTPASARERGSINFSKGKSSTTVTATVRPGDPDCWTYVARKGQRVRAQVDSKGGAVWLVLDPFTEGNEYNDLQIQIEERGARYQTFTVYQTGRQDVCVASHNKKRASYSLYLEIR
jgi:hypothetical protein